MLNWYVKYHFIYETTQSASQDNLNEAAVLLRNRRADLMKMNIEQGHHESVFFE